MMRRYWESARGKIDDMSLRERVLIFAAAAFVVISLMDTFLLEPLLSRQKDLSVKLVQQQEKMKEIHAQMQALLQAKSDDEHSPLRSHLGQLRQQLQEQDGFLQSRRDRLVEPGKMANTLEQVLNRNGQLELVALNTLPVEPLIEKPLQEGAAAQHAVSDQDAGQKQIFKHGVKITVRGSYPDLMQYLMALERMPVQMFWGEASLSVDQYPVASLTLTLYTLSLDKTWLAV
ncbi:MAG TPA: agglutinin biogenesis protein [Gallionella sp.]|nr:agglutinin biogenesis protein [Gallionella sp.]